MSTVLDQIEKQIATLSNKAVKKNTGTIRSVADGVANARANGCTVRHGVPD